MKNGELRFGDEEAKFNLTNNVSFVDNDKRTCMRVDSLTPSIGEVLHDMVERLEKYLTESLSMGDL